MWTRCCRQVLCDESDQSIFVDQLTLMTKLMNHLTKADMDAGGIGDLTKDDFKVRQ